MLPVARERVDSGGERGCRLPPHFLNKGDSKRGQGPDPVAIYRAWGLTDGSHGRFCRGFVILFCNPRHNHPEFIAES